MKRWGLSTAALVTFLGIFAFGLNHSRVSVPQQNSSIPAPIKKNAEDKAPQQPSTTIDTKKVETKNITETETVPYQTINKNDLSLDQGKTKVVTQGVNGVKAVTYNVTYVDSKETTRQKIKEEIMTQPVDQVTKVGIRIFSDSQDHTGPAGATALCTDGSLSFAEHHQGACSNHGGVSIWYQ
jgi:hypothetical protein